MRRVPTSEAGVRAIVARQPWDKLTPLIRQIGADPESTVAKLRLYATELVGWNSNVSNLMSRNDVARIVERHLVESLEPAPLLAERSYRSYLDFGSGAGFPAIPLAIVGVGDRWVLIESRRPKTLFLRKILTKLGLANVEVVHGRLENLDSGRRFDGFTARATERMGPTLRLAAPHVRLGGGAFLWKGSGWRQEIEAGQSWKESWEFVRSLELHDRPIVLTVFTRTTTS